MTTEEPLTTPSNLYRLVAVVSRAVAARVTWLCAFTCPDVMAVLAAYGPLANAMMSRLVMKEASIKLSTTNPGLWSNLHLTESIAAGIALMWTFVTGEGALACPGIAHW